MARQSVALSAENLNRHFGRGPARRVALNELSLQIPRGSWTTIAGPAGSGKTILFECLSGLSVPDSGRITLHPSGHSKRRPVHLSDLSESARARLRRDRIGVLSAGTELVAGLNLRDNIRLSSRLAGSRVNDEEFRELCDLLGLTEFLRHRPHQVPAGTRQRVRLARSLLIGPDLILADEPTAGIGRHAELELLELFGHLVEQQGLTLVIFSSQPKVAECGTRTRCLVDGQFSDDSGNLPLGPLALPEVPAVPAAQFAPFPGVNETRVAAGKGHPRC